MEPDELDEFWTHRRREAPEGQRPIPRPIRKRRQGILISLFDGTHLVREATESYFRRFETEFAWDKIIIAEMNASERNIVAKKFGYSSIYIYMMHWC